MCSKCPPSFSRHEEAFFSKSANSVRILNFFLELCNTLRSILSGLALVEKLSTVEFYLRVEKVELSRMSSCRHVENVKLSTCWECQIVDMSRISKKISKTQTVEKKLHVTALNNEFSTFSTLDVSSSEFSTSRLYMSTSIYPWHCQPWFL